MLLRTLRVGCWGLCGAAVTHSALHQRAPTTTIIITSTIQCIDNVTAANGSCVMIILYVSTYSDICHAAFTVTVPHCVTSMVLYYATSPFAATTSVNILTTTAEYCYCYH